MHREHVSRSGAGALLVTALALAVLSLPGLASAATVPAHVNSVVLAVLGPKHELRVVEGTRVLDVPYRGSLPAGATAGSRIRFVLSHLKASAVTVTGTADHVSVQGFVVQKGKGLYLRLADDSLLSLSRSSSRLKVGALARVVLRFTKGASVATPVTPGSSKPTTSSPGTTTPGTTTPANGKCARSDCMLDTVVSVLSIDTSGALTVLPVTGGAQLVLQPGQVDTATVYAGDFLHVTGTQSSSSGAYTLASLDELVGCDNATCTLTLDATVDEVDTSALIVEDQNGDEYQIGASAALLATNGLTSDADVHIVGTQDPNTGNYTATAITITK